MPVQDDTEWATIGKIVALFGVRGELKVISLSDIPDRFAQLEVVYLAPGYEKYELERVRPYKGEMLLIKLAGIDDANSAEAFRNREICIPVSQLAQLPPDSYYQHDILGLSVRTLNEQLVGSIVNIIETGSNDVYVVKTPVGSEVLIPAIKAIVKQVDLHRRTLYIDPIPGLLDENAEIDETD